LSDEANAKKRWKAEKQLMARHQAATGGRVFRQKDGKAGRLCTGFPTGNLTGRVEKSRISGRCGASLF